MLNRILLTTSLFFSSTLAVFAQESSSNQVPAIVIKKNEITGEYEIPDNFAGSATYISPKEIEEKQTKDINRIVREIPGVNVQEEDGYGLRPNIGLRGGRNDRSADISLMEDGILIAPAPYAASSAYYFPSMGRIKGIEVRKGSSSIKYGPRTTSGAVNLITTPIPDFAKGSFTSSLGQFDEKNFNFNYGDAGKNYGYVVNFDQQSSDGFKELDGAGTNAKSGNTGYDLTDFMAKFRVNTDKDAEIYQAVEFKVAVNDELSNETYVGLTLDDFVNNPYRRYVASAMDNMQAEHRQYELRHLIKPSKNFDITNTAYYHEFDRNWYKLDDVDDGTNGFEKIGTIFGDNMTSYLDVIRGDANGKLKIKANNRSYVAQGIQSVANSDFELENSKHNLEYGVRYHADYEDRFQHEDVYDITNGVISLETAGDPGSAGNKITSARSLSLFIEDEIELGNFTIVPGVRYEHIKFKLKDYNEADNRDFQPDTYKSSEDVIVPGIATNYKIKDGVNIFAGVHKGFSPPSAPNADGAADAEESINYEAGLRLRGKKSFLESVIFLNDYDNLLGNDTASSGGTGDGDQFNGGEVIAYGLELAAGYETKARILETSFKFPISASYTYNHAEFRSSFDEEGISEWGNVNKGDELPYIANHQFALNLGVEFNKIALNLTNKFVSEMRQSAGQGSIDKSDKIPAHWVTDFVGFYEFKPDQSIFFGVDNIFDREYAVALRPAGLRPGKPLTARVGLKINF